MANMCGSPSDRLSSIEELAKQMHSRHEGIFDLHEDIEFTLQEGRGVMARARKTIPAASEVLMVIANDERINYDTVTTDCPKLKPVIQAIASKSNEAVAEVEPRDVTLTALIMFILASSSSPRFQKVTKTWPSPEELATVMYWAQDDVVGLEGTFAEYLIVLGNQAEEKLFHEVILPAIQEHKMEESFFSSTSLSSDADGRFQQFRYAYNLCKSRCHEGNGDLSADIIPMIDLINGLPSNGDTNVALNPARFQTEQDGDIVDCTVLVNTREIAAGEELIISYGNIPPSACLYKYGFTPSVTQQKHPLGLLDLVNLWIPKEMAPKAAAVECLKQNGFPRTAEEIEDESFKILLSPLELAEWQKPFKGLGQELQKYMDNEPDQFKNLRQFIMLGQLANDEQIEHYRKNKTLTGKFKLEEMGESILHVIDWNIENLANANMSNAEELSSLKQNNDVSLRDRSILTCRILSRDTLARWRHAVCRYFALYSAADFDEEQRKIFDLDISFYKKTQPKCLDAGGCSVCGATIGTSKCARCCKALYCCKEHQLAHWPLHKPVCIPVGGVTKRIE